MASVALMGFLSGLIEGTTERIKKEREDNEALIDGRLKMAATNKLIRDKEVEAQKTLLMGRLDTVEAFAPTATYEQKLALVSSEALHDSFKKRSEEGVPIDLNTFLTINKDKVPQNYTTVKQYIDSLSAAPAPVSEEQMKALSEGEGFLGARVGPSLKAVEKRAQQYGMTARELLAYEQKQAVPSLSGLASMDVKQLQDTKIKPLDKRIEEADSLYASASMQYGKDSEQAIAAKQQSSILKTIKEELTPAQEKFNSYVGKLKLLMLKGDEKQKAEAAKEYEKVLAIENMGKGEEGGIPKVNTLSSLLSRASSKAVIDRYGPEVGKDLIIDTALDGSTSFRYIGTKPDVRAKVQEEASKAAFRTVQPYLTPDNKPLSRDVKVALLSQGFSFNEQGQVVMPSGDGAAPTAAPAAPTAGDIARNTGLARPSAAPASAPSPAKPSAAPTSAPSSNANIAEISPLDRAKGDQAAAVREIALIQASKDTDKQKQEKLLILNAELKKATDRVNELTKAAPTQAPAVPPGIATKPAMPTSAARPAPAVVSPTIPEGAIKDLQKNKDKPEIIAEFERKYGEGTAARYISRK